MNIYNVTAIASALIHKLTSVKENKRGSITRILLPCMIFIKNWVVANYNMLYSSCREMDTTQITMITLLCIYTCYANISWSLKWHYFISTLASLIFNTESTKMGRRLVICKRVNIFFIIYAYCFVLIFSAWKNNSSYFLKSLRVFPRIAADSQKSW